MTTERIYLSEWEWDCCGDPFGVGDDVTFTIGRTLWPSIASIATAAESHHDEETEATVHGRVLAIDLVATMYETRSELVEVPTPQPHNFGGFAMRPGVNTPPDAPPAREGFVWHERTVSEEIEGEPQLTATDRVPRAEVPDAPVHTGVHHQFSGYLVTLDTERSTTGE